MNLPDVNVLVYAHRSEMEPHERCRLWLEGELGAAQPFGVSPLVVSGFLRVVTHPKIFKDPSPLAEAILFARQITSRKNCRLIQPGPGHLELFLGLCQELQVSGNLVPDIFFAALAIESGCHWVTLDKGFARIPGLQWSLL